MRTATLAAVLVLAAGLAFAGAPPASPAPSGAKPGASPAASPEASPAAKPKDPERNECTGITKDGSAYSAKANDYQACLREITNAVKAKGCVGGAKTVEFEFHRGGMKSVKQMAACN